MQKVRRSRQAGTAQGKKYGYFLQNGSANNLGQRSCGRASIPPVKELEMWILSSAIPIVKRFHLPRKYSDGPEDRNQGESLSHIRRVGQFTNHSHHDSNVAIQYTPHAAARETMSALHRYPSAETIPNDQAPEGGREAET